MSSKNHRILYIRTDRIGDVLMNLPAIHLLRQTFPKSWITVMLDAPVAELLKDHPDIDEVLSISAGEFRKKFKYRLNLTLRIKKISFDLAIASNPDKFIHALLFFSRIPRRVGYDRKWAFFLNRKIRCKKNESPTHEIQKNLSLIKLISENTWDRSLDLPVNNFEKNQIEALLKEEGLAEKPFVVVHAGTSNPQKRWPEDCFAWLCDRIQSDLNLKVLLIGGEEEIGISKKVAAQSHEPVIDWTGRLSLRQLVALFHCPEVRLLVSSDSGPVHIAWISGIPAVVMYAKNVPGSDPGRWGPLDGKSEVIYKPISEITAEEVYGAVRKVIEKNESL